MITDPIEHVVDIAEVHGWECEIADDNGQANVSIPGRWNTHSVSLLWNPETEILIVRSVIPICSVPEFFQSELTRLTNYANAVSVFGSWYFQQTSDAMDYIVWRSEIHTALEHLDYERMTKIFTNTRVAFDTFYPAYMAFVTQKPRMQEIDGNLEYTNFDLDAEGAMDYTGASQLQGRA